MFKGFRDFLLRGNVIDLAVAVVIGAAFSAIVDALVKGFITPLIGFALGGKDATFLNSGLFLWGDIITAVINFVITAAVVYFLVVVPMNRAVALMKRNEQSPAAPEMTVDQKLLTEIRDALARQRS